MVKRTQQEALEKFFEASSPLELLVKIPEAHAVIDKYIEKI